MKMASLVKIFKALTLAIPMFTVSCQVSPAIKEVPLVGQIATGVNVIGQRGDLNETSSLFAPRNYKNERYRVPGGNPILDQDENVIGFENGQLLTYAEVIEKVRGDSAKEKEFALECTSRIDTNYHEWLEDYMRGRASLNTSLDILSQALSGAATVFTPASTVKILSGTSTFVQGANSTIESKFFLSLTALQQVPVMNKERKTTRNLLDGETDFQKQLRFLEEYYIAGTIFTALGVQED